MASPSKPRAASSAANAWPSSARQRRQVAAPLSRARQIGQSSKLSSLSGFEIEQNIVELPSIGFQGSSVIGNLRIADHLDKVD